ncbi:MAG: bifunctional folylpolyglutamate synthase/dihydrofolate synthase [Candidatus Omnitrophica bacterium]|nr:bifunctional folylpolyglutamate synthase/dihydrofolate synthase [Candidatus Omnitrophota bacterium]
MTCQEALEYLDSFLNYEQVVTYRYPEAFSLDRISRLLERLGNPHRRYPTLHVAGTKGKGSACAFASSILRTAGLRVGLYTSPHLISFRERIQINGQPISEEELTRIVEQVRPHAARGLTFFEVTTACAFLYFARAQVDAAVIEVGLGGRLDATNVLTPAVTAITPISLDHQSKLGNTVEKIAGEKAGIIKPGVPLVLAPQEPAAQKVIEETAAAQSAPIHRVEKETQAEILRLSLRGTRCTLKTPEGFYPDLFIPLLGRHQVMNAAAAVRMVELSPFRENSLNLEKIRAGLAHTSWPGRCQLIDGSPKILLDGAQNAASARALVETARELFPGSRVTLVLGISQDKDLEGIARVFGPWPGRLILTRASVPRAESPERLANLFQPWHPNPKILESVPAALEQAKAKTDPKDLIVVSGSLFVVGEALQHLSPSTGSGRADLLPAAPSQK